MRVRLGMMVLLALPVLGAQQVVVPQLGLPAARRPGLSYEDENPPLDWIALQQVHGRVRDRMRVAIPSVELGLFTNDTHKLVVATVSDADGSFDFGKHLPAGNYRLIAQYPGLCTMNLPLEVSLRAPRKSLEVRMEYPGLQVCSYATAH